MAPLPSHLTSIPLPRHDQDAQGHCKSPNFISTETTKRTKAHGAATLHDQYWSREHTRELFRLLGFQAAQGAHSFLKIYSRPFKDLFMITF